MSVCVCRRFSLTLGGFLSIVEVAADSKRGIACPPKDPFWESGKGKKERKGGRERGRERGIVWRDGRKKEGQANVLVRNPFPPEHATPILDCCLLLSCLICCPTHCL